MGEVLDPAHDSGDHLHPDDAGFQAMAGAVDLSILRRRSGGEAARLRT
ncbi:hypothetical protein [Streptomyces similanensis]